MIGKTTKTDQKKKQRTYIVPKLETLGKVWDITMTPASGSGASSKQSNQSDGTGVPATKAAAVGGGADDSA